MEEVEEHVEENHVKCAKPRTKNGKIVELAVKNIIEGNEVKR